MVSSPVLSNRRHCMKVLGIVGDVPENVVLFSEEAQVKNPLKEVMYISDFMQYLAGMPDVFSSDRIEHYFEMLLKYKKSIEPQMLLDFIIKRAKI